MGFGTAIERGILGFGDFEGRAGRAEFWWFYLFANLLGATAALIHDYLFFFLVAVLALPLFAVTARRLHDLGHTGWWSLLMVIPGANLFLLAYLARRGNPGENPFDRASSGSQNMMPPWVDVFVIPLISLLIAFAISALVIIFIGENPIDALRVMVIGALGSTYGWGYTLYYATNFMFTGLAFAVAFHAGLFNIGGEGQAMLGGLGVAIVCLAVPWPHWTLALPVAMVGGALFGAAWAAIPAWLQAKRGSHIVITTIMFNLIGASLLNYLLVNVMRPTGQMDPASARFPEGAHLPTFQELASVFGFTMFRGAPANVTFVVALLACVLVWLLVWRTRLGYEIRAYGKSEAAAIYAGISPVRITVVAMLMSGALAGLMAINNVMGEAERLVMNSVEGAGFIGIAVALMGRSHPFGVFLAAILFGFLYQGGAELSLWTNVPRELIVVIQALVILFTGALDNMVRMPLESLFVAYNRRKRPAPVRKPAE